MKIIVLIIGKRSVPFSETFDFYSKSKFKGNPGKVDQDFSKTEVEEW